MQTFQPILTLTIPVNWKETFTHRKVGRLACIMRGRCGG